MTDQDKEMIKRLRFNDWLDPFLPEVANCIEQLVAINEELVVERDLWKSRYEHHKNERLEALNLNTMQASKIGYLMETIVKLEKKISKLEKK